MLVDGIVLATLDRIKENLGSFLDALEEAVVLGTTSRCLFIGMMAKNLLSVGTLNLLLCRLESVL